MFAHAPQIVFVSEDHHEVHDSLFPLLREWSHVADLKQ